MDITSGNRSKCNVLLPFKGHCIYKDVMYCILGPDNTADDVYRNGQVLMVFGECP